MLHDPRSQDGLASRRNFIICLLESFSAVTEMTRCDKICQVRNLAIKLENNFCFYIF